VIISVLTTFKAKEVAAWEDISLVKIVEITENFLGSSQSPFFGKATKFILKFLAIQSTNFFHVSRVIIMVSSLSLVKMGKESENSMEKESSLKTAIKGFETLRAAVGNMNKVVGGIMLSQYIGILTLLANSPSMREWGLGDNGSIEKNYITFTYINFAIFMGVACDMPERVR